MAARGRPTQYTKEFAPLAFWMSKAGQTDSEIAEHFGVAPSTICAWKKKFPEFRKALKDGHQCPDRQVEQALFDRAIGYEYEEVDVIVDEDGETKTKTMTRQKAPSCSMSSQAIALAPRKACISAAAVAIPASAAFRRGSARSTRPTASPVWARSPRSNRTGARARMPS